MMPARLVLFDIDGTLVHTGGAGMRALDRAFAEEFSIDRAFAGYSFSGRTDRSILRDGFDRHFGREPTDGEIEQTRLAYLRCLDEELVATRDQYRILPGIIPLLDRLRTAGIPTGLATGNLLEGARKKLEAGGLWHYFPFGGFGSDHEHRGELTRKGIERARHHTGLHIAPAAVFVVGDSPLDVHAARYAGTRCIGVMTGWNTRKEMEEAGPDHLLDDLSDTEAVMAILLA